MTISLKGANISGSSNDPLYLPKTGDHLVRVRNIRMLAGHRGRKFFLDYTVVDGPSGAGCRAAYMVDLDNFFHGGQMTREMAYQKELGKIAKSIAAVLGYRNEDAGVVTDAVFAQAYEQRPQSGGGNGSIFTDRLVVIRVVPYKNKKGVDTSFSEVHPPSAWDGAFPAGYVDPTQAEAAPAASAPIEGRVAAKPPARPGAPKKAKTFEELAKEAGWEVHPDDPDYYWNTLDDTQDPVLATDLRATLSA